ncbi:HD-GYP domain-containing protein [Polynucleobacter sinensis]|uniref:HD-GYP domain-containing protein n=1 Tax=Polynucleobacter sinensis TaxID=1743157 RepID=UPI0009ED6E7C|nr:HD domain-containing phosphohydrolase [Polynucleobacter sinensis]
MTVSVIFALFLFFGMFSFAGAALLFIQYKNDRQPYILLWATASILIGIGVTTISLREHLPDFIAYKSANSLTLAAAVLFNYSLVSLNGKIIHYWRAVLNSLLFACCIAIVMLLVDRHLDPRHQPLVVASVSALLGFYGGYLANQFYKKSNIQLASVLAIIFYCGALVWAIRLITIIFYGVSFASDGGTLNAITFIFLLIFGILRYVFFTGLVLSIAERKREQFNQEFHDMKVELAKKKADQAELQLLSSLNALAKARDDETGNHIIRTQNYVRLLALRLRINGHYLDQLSDESIDLLVKATPLHDIGKIGIPDDILKKNGPLTDDEWVTMKTHTTIGESVLNTLEKDMLSEEDVIIKAVRIAGGHHEKWDGSGYPRGIRGDNIPLEARIMSLADMYDALVSKRVYKDAWSHDRAVEEIVLKRSIQFDPAIVDAFLEEQERFREIAKTYQDH